MLNSAHRSNFKALQGVSKIPTMTESRNTTALFTAFCAGVTTCFLASKLVESFKTRDRKNAGATVEGEDLSLFYGDVKELTTITDARKFLPSEIYGKLVRDCVVCCVDCLIVRTTEDGKKKECLLVERSSEPVKGVWWLPGGRLLKGETFFAAAKRKAQQETGLTDVTPIQVLGVWNTFFPTSHWDTDVEKGTQTVNPIVLVELNQPGADVKLDETSEQWRWIPLDPDVAAKNGEDKYVLQALLRLKAWNPAYDR